MSDLIRQQFSSRQGAELRALFENRHSAIYSFTVVTCLFGAPVPQDHVYDRALLHMYTYRVRRDPRA